MAEPAGKLRGGILWGGTGFAVLVPVILATQSPLLAWRDGVYIAAGFAGVIAMALLLIQPLLTGGLLPGLQGPKARRVHRMTGGLLVATVIIHVLALWITSPPDVIDVLLFASPTPFSVWGVAAMWAVFASAILSVYRRKLRPRSWRIGHSVLAVIIVTGSVVHALLIEGTMETVSKAVLCVLVVIVTARVLSGVCLRKP